MSQVPGSPLDQSHLEALNRLCRSCAETDQLIEACAQCGLPMDERRDKNNWQQQTAQAIKRVFYKGEP